MLQTPVGVCSRTLLRKRTPARLPVAEEHPRSPEESLFRAIVILEEHLATLLNLPAALPGLVTAWVVAKSPAGTLRIRRILMAIALAVPPFIRSRFWKSATSTDTLNTSPSSSPGEGSCGSSPSWRRHSWLRRRGRRNAQSGCSAPGPWASLHAGTIGVVHLEDGRFVCSTA